MNENKRQKVCDIPIYHKVRQAKALKLKILENKQACTLTSGIIVQGVF